MGVTAEMTQTEVGPLPSDWAVVPLGKLVRSVEYGSSAKSARSGAFPVLRMGNLQDGRIVWGDLVYTSDRSEFERYRLRCGDVLFNRTNTVDLVGKTSIYEGDRDALFAGYLIRIVVDPEKLDSRYLNYILNTPVAKRHSQKVLSVAVGQANINGQKLRTYPIPLPPRRAEQEAIAGALADADAWIESLEKLIAKKRQIKLGVMQQLLTGKRRLPGFNGEWQRRRLGEISDIRIGRTPSRLTTAFWGAGHPWLSIADLQSKVVSQSNEQITSLAAADMAVVRKGTLLMSFKLSLGRLCFAGCDLYTNEAICSLNDPQADVEFLYYSLGRTDFSLYGKQAVKGYTLNKESLKAVEISLPQREEQRQIGAVLADLDGDIEALEAKLAKARQIKQGMMQTLLTGKVRLA